MVTGYMSLLTGPSEQDTPPSLKELPRAGYMTALGGPRIGQEWKGASIEDDDDGSGLLTPFSEFKKGMWSSLTSGNINMLGGAAEAFEVLGGSDPETTTGRATQNWINDPSRQTELPKTWAESKGLIGVMGYLSGLTGQALGSMAAPMAAGAVGGAAGSVVPGVGTTIGAVGGAFSVGAMLNIGETYLQLRDEGVDPKEASKYAVSIGTGLGVIDTVGLGRVLGATALKEVKKKAISEISKQAARGYLRGATEEGITETVQAGIRETVAGALTDNPNLQERALNALHEGFAGALGGGAIGGAGRATRAALDRRPTLAERTGEDGDVPAELLKGDALDDLVKKGHKATRALLGDNESNRILDEMGLPSIGSDVTFSNEEGNQRYKVKGWIPQDAKGPQALLVEDDQGVENQLELPLRDNESLRVTEEVEQERASEQFIEDANGLAPPGQPGNLEAVMREEGYKTLAAVPEDKRADFLAKLKKRSDDDQRQLEAEEKTADGNMVFNTQMETMRDTYEQVPNFDAIDSTVRDQMGLQPEEGIPESRRKPYLEAMKLRLQAAAKKGGKQESPEAQAEKLQTATEVESSAGLRETAETARFEVPEEGVPPREGTYAFAAENRPALPTLPSMQQAERLQMPKELVRRSDILRDLSQKLGGIPIRVGRIRQRGGPGSTTQGIYKVEEEAIRLREALDIPVAAHEVGHHVNKLMYGGEKGRLNWEPLQPYRDELGPIATPSRKGESSLPEGFAEFVRLYLTDPSEAQSKAPQFYSAFEQQLTEFPELQEVLSETQTQIRRYVEQPSSAKVLAHISKEDTSTPINRFDNYYANMIDRLYPLKQAVEGMAQQAKRRVPMTERNAYEMARLFSGWAGKADHFVNQGTFNPNNLEGTGESLKQILAPVEGRLDDLRIYLTARRVVEKEGQGKKTGISVADAQQAIKDLESPELQQAAEKLYAYQDQVLRYMVDSNYLSQEQYDAITTLNENYVPFYRVMDESAPGGGRVSGKSMVDLWDPVKRMKGSTREIVDPLESIFKNTYTLINLAERNRVAQVFTEQAARSEGSAKWLEKIPAKMTGTQFTLAEIKTTLENAGIEIEAMTDKDLETVATVFRPIGQGSQQENVVTVFKDGKRTLWQTTPELYRVMKDLDSESSNLMTTILSKPAALLRLGATGISPEFVIRNPVRDAWTAIIQSQSGFTPADWFRGIFHAVKKDGLYQEWQKAGGEFAAMASMDRSAIQKNLDDMLASPARFAISHPIQALRALSELAEASTRLGEYEAAKRRGATERQAALASREVTLDFARIGASTKAVNRIVAFWNAAVQGTEKLIRVHKENPVGTVAKAFVGITIPSVALYALNHDDEDFHELPQWQKDFFWMVPLGEKGSFLRVPKPFLWGLIYGSTVERALDWINEKDPRAFKGLLNSYFQASAPAILPTAILPVIEGITNHSFFTGRAVVPGYLERLPAEHQHTPWTSEFSKGMAGMAKSFGIQVSPMVIDNTVYGYTGGTGRYVLQGVTEAHDLVTGSGSKKPSATLSDLPLVKGFVTRYPQGGTESLARLYEDLSVLERKRAALSYARKFRNIEADPMSREEWSQYNILKGAQKRLSNLTSVARRTELSEQTSEQKRKRLDELSWIRVNIARNAMKRVEALTSN